MLQTSVYQVVTAFKCDYSSQIYLARGFLRGKQSGLAQVSPSSKYSDMWPGCCKSMLCPDKSFHVLGMSREMSSGQNLQSFRHNSTALITHLENGIQFLDHTNFVPQSTGIQYLKNIQARLPPAFVSDPLTVTQREPLNHGPSPQWNPTTLDFWRENSQVT